MGVTAAPARVRVRVPAKVNLWLGVGPLRADGYHEVASILQAVTLFDRLTVEPAPHLTVVCRAAGVPAGPANLAWRAAEALAAFAGRGTGLRITIRKGIPIEAGLGGGSADAAAVLAAAAALWGLPGGRPALEPLAAALGSDVPFFLRGGTALALGRGEQVRPLPPLPAWPGLVVKPGFGMRTADAYAAFDRLRPAAHGADLPAAERAAASPSRAALAGAMANDLEPVVAAGHPDLAAARAELLAAGALGVVMCGSGSALFALARSRAWAAERARSFRSRGWFGRAVSLWASGAEVHAART
jgi:4-diphosphocytidyl-2-C-methyl-D-erythritol kinase